jgi:serine/threonine protein kinase
MEHLEGETLAGRLRRGALPLPQALEFAAQIADALSAAHKQGIVHRDLKPGNVMLTKTGVKLLDFGLARLVGQGERPPAEALTSAPTEAAPLTGQRTLLGTVPYMAPEQVEGQPADGRTDLWALGTVIYEMVTGRRAFDGASSASLVASILAHEPAPLATAQPLTPPGTEDAQAIAVSSDGLWVAFWATRARPATSP